MPYALLEQKIKALPEECFEELSRYVDFISYKLQKKNDNEKTKRQLGIMKGKIKIAPDFDEELDCFEEYK